MESDNVQLQPNSSIPFDPNSSEFFDQILYYFLHCSPINFHYEDIDSDEGSKDSLSLLSQESKDNLIKFLNSKLCGVTEDHEDLVFGKNIGFVCGTSQESKQLQQEQQQSTSTNDADVPLEYRESQRGKACGHVFKKGEAVYRCRTCGLDDTCVMCSTCFKETHNPDDPNFDHRSHDTSFHIASGSGGCCDCGDPEAWKVPLYCQYHSPLGTLQGDNLQSQDAKPEESQIVTPLPESLVQAMKTTLGTCLDFVIDTFELSPTATAMDQSNTFKSEDYIVKADPPIETRQSITGEQIPDDNFGPLYSLVLWNDEVHSYQEVIETVSEACSVSRGAARRVAERVDAHGRDVVLNSDSIQDLLQARQIFEPTNLATTIRPRREIFREAVAHEICVWLQMLLNRVQRGLQKQTISRRNESGQVVEEEVLYESVELVLRKVICQELMRPRRSCRSVLFPNSITDEARQRITDYLKDKSLLHRLDYLLAFDSRLWKQLRIMLKEFYISTFIVSGEEFKMDFGMRYCHNYFTLLEDYMFADREHDLSLMNFSVQLFTVPSISAHVFSAQPTTNDMTASSNELDNSSPIGFWEKLNYIVKAFLLADSLHDSLFSKFVAQLSHPSRRRDQGDDDDDNSDHISVATIINLARSLHQTQKWYPMLSFENSDVIRNRKVWHLFHDLRYFLTSPVIRKQLLRQDVEHKLLGLVEVCCVLQGMNPQVRRANVHVEYESDTWVHAFNMSLQMSRLLVLLGQTLSSTIMTEDSPATENLPDLAKSEWDAFLKSIPVVLDTLTGWLNGEIVRRVGQGFDDYKSLELNIVDEDEFVVDFVPDFVVKKRPSSFHHPLHWLFANLLQQIPGLLTALAKHASPDVISETLDKDIWSDLIFRDDLITRVQLCELFDIPIRTLVLSSQIKTGLWVRNGFSIRSQEMYYRQLSLRETAHDMDIFLVQVGIASSSGSWVLLDLLDKFELVHWFIGGDMAKLSEESGYSDKNQVLQLVEELLHLIIVLYTERSKVLNMSLQEICRKEVIHVLAAHSSLLSTSSSTAAAGGFAGNATDIGGGLAAVDFGTTDSEGDEDMDDGEFEIDDEDDEAGLGDMGGMEFPPRTVTMASGGGGGGIPFSELQKRLAEDCSDDTTLVESILRDVAVFRMTTQRGGVYELKDDSNIWEKEVDPFYWHLGGHRSEVEEAVKRWTQEQLKKRHTSFRVKKPQVKPIPKESGFSALHDFVCSSEFVMVLVGGLWNFVRNDSERVTNEVILGQLIWLVLCGLERDASMSGSNAQTESFVSMASRVKFILKENSSTPSYELSLLDVLIRFTDMLHEISGATTTTDQTIPSVDTAVAKEAARKLAYILERFGALGTETTKTILSDWEKFKEERKRKIAAEAAAAAAVAAASNTAGEGATTGPEESEAERKKREAKERQAAIMAQFASQQKQFLEAYGDDMDEDEDEYGEEDDLHMGEFGSSSKGKERAVEGQDLGGTDLDVEAPFVKETREWQFPKGSCIVCQEELNEKCSSLYGMLGYMQLTRLVRNLDWEDSDIVYDISQSPATLDVEVSLGDDSTFPSLIRAASGPSFASPITPVPPTPSAQEKRPAICSSSTTPLKQISSVSDGGFAATTCGHLMHYHCFETYKESVAARQMSAPGRNHPEDLDRNEFSCPLCRSLGNCLVPVLFSSKREKVMQVGAKFRQGDPFEEDKATMRCLNAMSEWFQSTVLDGPVAMHLLDDSVQGKDKEKQGERSSNAMDIEMTTPEATTRDSNALPGSLPPAQSQQQQQPAPASPISRQNSSADVLRRQLSHSSSAIMNRGFMASLTSAAPSSSAGSANANANANGGIGNLGRLLPMLLNQIRPNTNAQTGESSSDATNEPVPQVLQSIADRWLETLWLIRSSSTSLDQTSRMRFFEKSLGWLKELLECTYGCVEIQSRGGPLSSSSLNSKQSKTNTTILDTLSEQTLTWLRTLGESTLAVSHLYRQLQSNDTKKPSKRASSSNLWYYYQGFEPFTKMIPRSQSKQPLLLEDAFTLLVDMSVNYAPFAHGDGSPLQNMFNWVKLHYVLQVIRIILSIIESSVFNEDPWVADERMTKLASDATTPSSNLENFMLWMLEQMNIKSLETRTKILNKLPLSLFTETLLPKLLLPFLRKCVLLMYTQYGVVPDMTLEGSSDMSEFERLVLLLDVPSLESIFRLHECDQEQMTSLGSAKRAPSSDIPYNVTKFVKGQLMYLGEDLKSDFLVDLCRKVGGGSSNVSEQGSMDETQAEKVGVNADDIDIHRGDGNMLTDTEEDDYDSEEEEDDYLESYDEEEEDEDEEESSEDDFEDEEDDEDDEDEEGVDIDAAMATAANMLGLRRRPPRRRVRVFGRQFSTIRLFKIQTPIVYELVTLPRRLDTLFEESVKAVCKRCGQTPTEPALCLFCGTFVCSQSFCCMENEMGECNLHAAQCGGDVGAYLLVKKSIILFLHWSNGCFIASPYLDSHGEVDVGLKRGRPMFLHQRRYNEEIRKVWIQQTIPSFVARRIDSNSDAGGWFTL